MCYKGSDFAPFLQISGGTATTQRNPDDVQCSLLFSAALSGAIEGEKNKKN